VVALTKVEKGGRGGFGRFLRVVNSGGVRRYKDVSGHHIVNLSLKLMER